MRQQPMWLNVCFEAEERPRCRRAATYTYTLGQHRGSCERSLTLRIHHALFEMIARQ
jgi:hypothetical protein